jgi:hypothetical protein
MAQVWKRFDLANVVKANSPDRIFVIRRPNSKMNCGIIESFSPAGVILSNGNWTYEVAFNDGPPKMFMAFDPPAVDITVADSKLI